MLVLAGCATAVSGQPSAPPPASPPTEMRYGPELACHVLSDAELTQLGMRVPGTPFDNRDNRLAPFTGCNFTGSVYTLSLNVDNFHTVDVEKQERDKLADFVVNDINGRPGVRYRPRPNDPVCGQLFNFGSGSFLVLIAPRFGHEKDTDWCAKATQIAELVEPRLPK